MKIPEIVPRELVVAGVPLLVRAITPEDEAALRAGFEKLSPEARYARFRGVGAPSDAQWRYLTRVDGERHVAVVAVTRGGEIVGVARFVATEHPGEAELAFTIADDHRRRRLGTVLLDVLVPLARARGIARLVAYTAAENHGMIRLVVARGGAIVSTRQGEAELALATTRAEPATPRRGPSRRARARALSIRFAARARRSARRAMRITRLDAVLAWLERSTSAAHAPHE